MKFKRMEDKVVWVISIFFGRNLMVPFLKSINLDYNVFITYLNVTNEIHIQFLNMSLAV